MWDNSRIVSEITIKTEKYIIYDRIVSNFYEKYYFLLFLKIWSKMLS